MTKKVFPYVKTHEMKPREGNKFATTYYKQTVDERNKQAKWLTERIRTFVELVDANEDLAEAVHLPLKGFPKTRGKNRSLWEIVEDMAGEIQGKKRDGMPKDFAQAPIERWNKFFDELDGWGFDMEQRSPFDPKPNTFNEIFNFATVQSAVVWMQFISWH